MARPVRGVNIDLRDNTARPDNPAAVKSLGYFRFVLIVNQGHINLQNGQSFNQATVDQVFRDHYVPERFNPALDFYDPYIQACLANDVKPIITFTHQTFGEGWFLDFGNKMQDGGDPAAVANWALLSRKLSELAVRVAQKYGTKVVYQIWNEQDHSSGSAVGVPANCYADMLTICAQAIRGVEGGAIIISGGHADKDAIKYWRTARSANPYIDSINGIDIHPYNCGMDTFVQHGAATVRQRLKDGILAWSNNFPNSTAAKSIWITEFGCGANPAMTDAVAGQYAKTFFGAVEGPWKNIVKAACWFGWGPNMNAAAGCYALGPSVAQNSDLWKAFKASATALAALNGAAPGAAHAAAFAAGGLGAPPIPNAFNGHYELDPGNGTQWRRAWGWVRGGGGNNRILKLLATPDAPYSTPQMRNGAPANTFVEQAISYLAPETTNRYAPILDGDGNLQTTFCNIFVNDATRVLWCEIPNNPANTVVGFMRQWLDQFGAAEGWAKTTDGNAAQDHVNNGHIAVMVWSKGSASDHIALVRPGTGEAHGGVFFPRIAQAGKVVSSDVSSHVTFGFVVSQDSTALAFYLHD